MWSIKSKIIFWFLFPSIIMGTVATSFCYFYTRKMVEQNIYNQLEIAADSLQENINLFIQEKRNQTLVFGSDGFIRSYACEITGKMSRKEYYSATLINHLVTNKKPLDPDILSIFIVDFSGKIVVSTEIGDIGKDISGEVYFKEAMRRGSYISDIHHSPGIKQITFEVARTFLSRDSNKPIALIVNRYNGESLKQFTHSGISELEHERQLEGLGETGELYIVNRDNLMITESRFKKDVILKQVVDTEGVRAAFYNGEGVVGIYTGYRGIPVLGVSRYIEDIDWVVLAEKDVSEAFAPLVRLRNFTISMGVGGIIVIVIVAIFLARGITRPVNKLVEGTRRISKGDLIYKIDVQSRDEIGYLASSFNDMTHRLGESKKQLQDYVNNLEKKVEGKTKELRSSLNEKEALLKEIHHRVKNNMQIMSSLLKLQSNNIKDERLIDIFQESQNRIKSMALIHEELYQSKDLALVDFAEYIRVLTGRLIKSYVVDPNSILLDVNVDKVFLKVGTAIPCGLIINELFSNSLKYAFPSLTVNTEQRLEENAQREQRKVKREICVNFHSDNNKYTLVFSDNGVGLPEDLDYRNTKTLGLELVNTLTDQIDGTIELDRNSGTEFKITFEV